MWILVFFSTGTAVVNSARRFVCVYFFFSDVGWMLKDKHTSVSIFPGGEGGGYGEPSVYEVSYEVVLFVALIVLL